MSYATWALTQRQFKGVEPHVKGSNRIFIGTRQLIQILEEKMRFDPFKL